jgi:phospholipid-binding lipoprotein MlaA
MNANMTLRFAALLLLAGVASGCATNNPRDPLEPFNRAMYTVNETVDKAVIRPVAVGYKAVTPELVRAGIGNFFDNLSVPATVVNSLLQGKVGEAAEGVMRFSFNTIFGFAGVLDIASEMRIPRRYEDFGQTLGKWGVPSGPYLVLPVLGPSTVRDTAGSFAYGQAKDLNPYKYIDNGKDETQLGLQFLQGIELRADLLASERMLNELALDKYTFVRDTYLQRRRNAVYDGDPPEEPIKPEPSEQPAKSEKQEQSPPLAPEAPAKPEIAPKSQAPADLLPGATGVSVAPKAPNESTTERSQELKMSQAAPFSTALNKE